MSTTALPRREWLGLDRAAATHALLLFVAAWLSFAIAALLHIDNAFWAAMPVWVVAQSSRGLLLERGFFRVVGTLVGCATGFGLLAVVPGGHAQLAALAVWVALCAGLVHMLRGVHAYGAMMAGMSAAVVVLPSVLAPAQAMALAIARVECTLIGVVVVTLVTGCFTPGTRRDAFYARVQRLADDAAALAAALARGDAASGRTDATRRVLAEISEVEAAASMVSAGSVDGYRRLRHINALVLAALAALAAGQALGEQRRRNHAAPLALPAAADTETAELDADALDRDPGSPPARLAEALGRLATAQAALRADPDTADARSFGPKMAYLAPQRDWAMARRAALVSGGATFVAASAAYASGRIEGELTALGVCIFSMVLGSMPRPERVAPHLFIGVTAGVAAATLYRFLVQPHADGLAPLVLTIAPFMMLGALARASRHTAIPALDTNMCFMLASQAGMPAAAAAEILRGSAALVLAAALVTGGFLLAPPRPARLAARLVADIRRDLRRLAAQPAPRLPGGRARAARHILQLMLHLGRAGELGEHPPAALLGVLNLGQAIVSLRAAMAQPTLGAVDRAAAQAGLDALAALDEPARAADALRTAAARATVRRIAAMLSDATDALDESAALLGPRGPTRRGRKHAGHAG